MSDIVELLLKAREASKLSRDLVGKMTGISIAPVYKVYPDDTIEVLLPETGGRSVSPRLYRVLPTWSLTYPAVRVGDTVCYGFIEGNPNKGVYWGVLHNAVNPPDDLTTTTHRVGNTIVKNTPDVLSQYHTTEEDNSDASGIVITEDGVKLSKLGGAETSITVEQGAIILRVGAMVITITELGIDVQGGYLGLSGAQSVTINNKQVTTIGAKDTDNDTLTTRGW